MSVRYKDYYKTLGVTRDASQDELRKSFRKLARKLHPDVNKEPDAEDRFKEINEAYEVLKDPGKRKRYDALGGRWQDGQEFQAPPGFEHFQQQFGGQGFRGGFEGVSDFFDTLFGGQAPQAGGPMGGPHIRRGPPAAKGRDIEAPIEVSLDEAFRGTTKKLELESRDRRRGMVQDRKSYDVTIPKGVVDGSKIRLAGQGSPGPGGHNGDLFLRVKLAKHPRFRVDGRDVETNLEITPWEAALGAEVEVVTLDGTVTLTLPAGVAGGKRLRLRGKGLPKPGGKNGDMFARIVIVVPKTLTDEERALFEQLRDTSEFRPRE